MKIAVVGGGIASYHILKYLLRDKQSKMKITVYDEENLIGRGRAFQADDDALLLNYPSNLISLKKHKDDDFYGWLKKNQLDDSENQGGRQEDADGNVYYSRQLFGQYVHDYFHRLIKKGDIKVRNEQAESVLKVDNGMRVNGKRYDYVFLAVGQLPAADVYQLNGHDGFISWPYPLYRLDVEPGKDYAVIGTGLSALDCIRYLHANGVKVIAASRNGQLPAVRGRMRTFDFKYFTHEAMQNIRTKHHDTIPLDELKAVFLKECEYQEIDIVRWLNDDRSDIIRTIKHDIKHHAALGGVHSILYYMQQLGSYIWPYMTQHDRSIFIERYQPLLKRNMNPMPQPTAVELLNLLGDGSAVVKSGLIDVAYKYRKFRLQYKDGSEDRVHYVINATGPAKQLSDVTAGVMLERLLEENIIMSCQDGGIQVVPHDNRIISPKYGVMDELMAVGPLTGGVNYGNNGVYELLLEAERVVKAFYDRI